MSFSKLYAGFMKVAEGINLVAITILFTVCYLVVVPIFAVILWFKDPLGLRKSDRATYWITKTNSGSQNFERLG